MTEYFVTSVADARLYDASDNLVGIGKALMDSSVDVTTSSTDVRGGKGNALQFIYFHSGDMSVTLTDVQFNLDFIAQTVGSSLTTGANVYTEETITLAAGAVGTVAGTPLAIQGTALYGWATFADGTVEKVTFTGQAFTSSGGAEGDIVCVRYFHLDSAAKSVAIYSNIIPNKVRLVLDAQLASKGEASAAVVGGVEVIVPTFQLSGAFALNMTADQVAQTPLTGRALASPVSAGGCSANDVLAYILRTLDGANWYDDVTALAIVGGDITLSATLGTSQLVVKSLHEDGSIGNPPLADLTFATDAAGTATVSAGGLITGVAAGSTFITATITADPTIDASVGVTVPA